MYYVCNTSLEYETNASGKEEEWMWKPTFVSTKDLKFLGYFKRHSSTYLANEANIFKKNWVWLLPFLWKVSCQDTINSANIDYGSVHILTHELLELQRSKCIMKDKLKRWLSCSRKCWLHSLHIYEPVWMLWW